MYEKDKTYPKKLYSGEVKEYSGDNCGLRWHLAEGTNDSAVFNEYCEICTLPEPHNDVNKMVGVAREDMGGPLVIMEPHPAGLVPECIYGVINSPQVINDLEISRFPKRHTKKVPVKYSGWSKHVRVTYMEYVIDELMRGEIKPDWVENDIC